MQSTRRNGLARLGALCLMSVAASARAQDRAAGWPIRPVKVIVEYSDKPLA